MVTYMHRSNNFIRLTIVLLLKFGLIPENASLSCVKRYRMEEESERRALSVNWQPLALYFIRVEKRVAQYNGQEPRQPSFKVNRTARLSSPGLCLFCPLQAPPEKFWHTASQLCAHALQTGSLQAPYLCAGSAAALELLPCALLGWFSSQKIPRVLLGYHCLQSACSFSMHAAAGSCGAETWKIASRDLLSSSRLPVVSQK